jgi:hypothetical protein
MMIYTGQKDLDILFPLYMLPIRPYCIISAIVAINVDSSLPTKTHSVPDIILGSQITDIP